MPPVQIADLTGAYLAAIGVLGALVARATTGRGQFVDISMMDGVVPWMVSMLPRFWFDGELPRRGVQLPGLVGECGFESDEGRLRALVGLGRD